MIFGAYADIDMRGLDESLYASVPRTVQSAVDVFPGDTMRLIRNDKIDCYTVVARSPGKVTKWHDGTYLREWAIVCHAPPHMDVRDAGDWCATQIRSMHRLLDYRDEEAAADGVEARIDEVAAAAKARDDQEHSDFFDEHYPKNYTEAIALERDVEKLDKWTADQESRSRAHTHTKLILPPGYKRKGA